MKILCYIAGLGLLMCICFVGGMAIFSFANIPSHDSPPLEVKTETCLNDAAFEKACKYIYLKQHTAKKLGPSHGVLFDGYELKIVEEKQAGKRIVFSKDGYKFFSVDMRGYIPHTKVDKKQHYNDVFCKLVEAAQQYGVPDNYAYSFADGNGNVWQIADSQVKYIPVTPKNSSSGMYSGGEAFTFAIDVSQFQEIEQMMLKALHQVADHSLERSMGTAAISQLVGNAFVQKCYLKNNSSHAEAIAQYLKKMKL